MPLGWWIGWGFEGAAWTAGRRAIAVKARERSIFRALMIDSQEERQSGIEETTSYRDYYPSPEAMNDDLSSHPGYGLISMQLKESFSQP
jgi:hypothetical protein